MEIEQQLRSSRKRKKSTYISKAIEQLDRFSTRTKWLAFAMGIYAIFIMSVDDLSYSGKIALLLFTLAMMLWIFTVLPAGFVALGTLVFIVLLKGAPASMLFESISEEIVWLMIGAFIIGESVKESGLASRFTRFLLSHATKQEHFLIWLTVVIQPLTFFIPSTSGRAALMMPIVQELEPMLSGKKQKRAVAMLIPVVILLASSATIIGAGSHIIGIGLLNSTTGEDISYLSWVLWGAPFAFVISGLALLVIRRKFWEDGNETDGLNKTQRPEKQVPLSIKEKKTIAIIVGLILLWMTESLHGYDVAFVAMVGAVFFMIPSFGIIEWKQGIKSVSWNLILFVAAATALGKALVESNVVDWMQKMVFSNLGFLQNAPTILILLIILLISVSSHLYITSHTARAVVMIPAFLLLSQTLGLNASSVVFLSLVGMNYSNTFPVSSKALLLFYEEGTVSYQAKDLIRLSLILMPIYVLVMVFFYYTYWKWTGLSL